VGDRSDQDCVVSQKQCAEFFTETALFLRRHLAHLEKMEGIGVAIESGVLAPGARLPSWQDLAAQLGVARGLRKAVCSELSSTHRFLASALPISQVTNRGNQKDLVKLLRQATSEINKGHYCKAVEKLNQAILRTDGFPLRNALDLKGDGRDWITNAAAQTAVYADLSAALTAITGLPCGVPPGHSHDVDDPDDNDD
jgi:DNA-binding transcriptional MocR family regulator